MPQRDHARVLGRGHGLDEVPVQLTEEQSPNQLWKLGTTGRHGAASDGGCEERTCLRKMVVDDDEIVHKGMESSGIVPSHDSLAPETDVNELLRDYLQVSDGNDSEFSAFTISMSEGIRRLPC